jgi:hypothetical protein
MLEKAARRALLVGLFVATGVVGPVTSTPAYAISGGEPAPNGSYGFVAKINLPGRSCSAVLIDPQWLVTSKSCFVGLDAATGTAIVGRTDLTGTAGREVKIARAVPERNRNVALVKLATRIDDIAPVRIAGNAATRGDVVRGAGYGRTTSKWVPRQLQTARFSVRAVTDDTLDVVGEPPTEVGTCKGDAGGPLLRESGNNIELLAIHAASSRNGCFGESPTGNGATGVRVDNITAWLRQTILDLSAAPAAKHAIELKWHPVWAQGSASYRVHGSTSPEVKVEAATLLGTTSGTSFVHRGLPAKQTWHYRIVPVTPAGAEEEASSVVSATTRVAPTTDFTGDGKDDIATFPRGSNGAALVAASTGSVFGGAAWWHNFFAFNDDLPLAGDFNGDDRADVASVQRGGSGAVSVALSDGSRFGVSQKWHEGSSVGNKVPVVGDFNGDGKDDVATFQRDNGHVFVALSTGSAFGESKPWHTFFAFGGELPVAGDFNGDGKDDIATFHRGTTGLVYVALSSGSGFGDSQKWHGFFSIGAEVPAIGDFDGDGRDDVVTFQQGVTSRANVTLSTGSSFGAGYATWNERFSLKGEVPGVADFDGDGRDDVVTFQRGDTADVWVARSNGAAFVDARVWHQNFAIGREIPVPGQVL